MKAKPQLSMLVILSVMLNMALAALADTGGTDVSPVELEPYPYISPTPGEFPIIGWGLHVETSYDIIKDFVECGFNAPPVSPMIFKQLTSVLNPVKGRDTIKLNLIPRYE